MQGRFIKVQLTSSSKCYLKFNSQFPNMVIKAVHSKSLQLDSHNVVCTLINIKS